MMSIGRPGPAQKYICLFVCFFFVLLLPCCVFLCFFSSVYVSLVVAVFIVILALLLFLIVAVTAVLQSCFGIAVAAAHFFVFLFALAIVPCSPSASMPTSSGFPHICRTSDIDRALFDLAIPLTTAKAQRTF